MVEIHLYGDVEGILDVKEGTSVPLTYKIGDIRDVFSRAGLFSKTITLAGTKNNNLLLNSYFDVNVVDGDFDVNKIHKCSISQDGEIIVNDGVLRLLRVRKTTNNLNQDDLVEYEVQVIDTVGDFFKEVNNKTLKDLRYYEGKKFIYGLDDMFDKWNNIGTEDYTYLFPYKNENYRYSDFIPAIYARSYFEFIHQEGGVRYNISDNVINKGKFNDLIIPFSGNYDEVIEEINEDARVIVFEDTPQQVYEQYLFSNSLNKSFQDKLTLSNVVQDFGGYFNPTTYKFTIPYDLSEDVGLTIQGNIEFMYGMWLQSWGQGTAQLRLMPQEEGAIVKIKPVVLASIDSNPVNLKGGISVISHSSSGSDVDSSSPLFRFNSEGVVEAYQDPNNLGFENFNGYDFYDAPFKFFDGKATFEFNLKEKGGIDGFSGITPSEGYFKQGDVIEFRFGIQIQNIVPGYEINQVVVPFTNGYNTPLEMGLVMEVDYIDLNITLKDNSIIPENYPVKLERFIHKDIKQSDFLRSIYNLFNIYPLYNKDTATIDYLTRDEFYDSGEEKDWSSKLVRDKGTSITFLPEVVNREVTLGYAIDNEDTDLYRYYRTYKEHFGDKIIRFNNRNASGESRKEPIFSLPVMRQRTDGIVLPRYELDFGVKILWYNGFKIDLNSTITIEGEGLQFYPQFGIFDDNSKPRMSLEYGFSESYGYNLTIPPRNNLYNTFWQRTFDQINEGRMLSAYFYLSASDVANIKMNDIIIVDGRKYFINTIKDYDANKDSPTKVELLTVESSFD